MFGILKQIWKFVKKKNIEIWKNNWKCRKKNWTFGKKIGYLTKNLIFPEELENLVKKLGPTLQTLTKTSSCKIQIHSSTSNFNFKTIYFEHQVQIST